MTIFSDQGFVVLTNVFTAKEVRRTLRAALQRAQMTLSDFGSILDKTATPFYLHGAVAETPSLWPLLVDDGLVNEISCVIATNCKCLAGIDTVGVHYSEHDPHRDVSLGQLPCLVDKPSDTNYDVVRVITYPSPGTTRFGVLPGSSRTRIFRRYRRRSSWSIPLCGPQSTELTPIRRRS
jgi:hypothetical protein